MQIAGDVRQRKHHHERLLRLLFVGREETALFPPSIEVGLDGGRAEVLFREIKRRLRRSGHRLRHRSYLRRFRENKNAASSKDERRRGTTLASHGSAPCLMSPVTGGPDPARGRPSEPVARHPFTSRAPSLSL